MSNIPAFPKPKLMQQAVSFEQEDGMTLREYFAAKAMQGMFANPDDGHNFYEMTYEEYVREIARCAYLMADAMMEARK